MQTPSADIGLTESLDQPKGGRVLSGIREAADLTGVSFDYLLAQATQESGLDPHARSSKSTASGLFQFTASTWLEMVKKHGADHGLGKEAAVIAKGADGKLDVADKAAKKAILDLRKDPKLSSMMAAEYAKDNARILESRLGRPASASDLYLAHFLGAGGAARVIEGMEDNPRHSAQHLLPEAARANPDVFHEPGSRKARTVAGLYKSVQARFKSALGAGASSSAPAISDGNPQLAALRPEPRPTQPSAEMPTAMTTTAVAAMSGAATSPTAVAVAMTATAVATNATVTAPTLTGAFASAVQPDSPFFPAPIPAAPTRSLPENLSLRAIVEAVKAGQDV